MTNNIISEQERLLQKWDAILNVENVPPIKSYERKVATARLLENAALSISTGQMVKSPLADLITEDAPTNNTGGVQNYDPVMFSLIRRSAPRLISYDIMGVQPMTGPTSTVFYMRSRYGDMKGKEALFGEANTGFSTINTPDPNVLGDAGTNVGDAPTGKVETYNYAAAMKLSQAEALGSKNSQDWAEMAISIDKTSIEAKSRKLKAEYTHEFAQDLKAIHGLDAVRELSNVLATELTAEINREAIRTVYGVAKIGSPASRVTDEGVIDLDVDTNGRWSAERWVGLHMMIEMEANDLAKATRRGRGNIILCSSNVASALRAAKLLNITDAANLQIDDTGNTFAGTMGQMKVYIDPYAMEDFIIVGYKGQHVWDSGIYYCPYTPFQQIKSLTSDTLTPIIGFQTRYGIMQNPFAGGANVIEDGKIKPNSNEYYRLSLIKNLM